MVLGKSDLETEVTVLQELTFYSVLIWEIMQLSRVSK